MSMSAEQTRLHSVECCHAVLRAPGVESSLAYRQPALPSANHTRIIELQPAAKESESLHIEITVVDLSSPLASYEALSYTWGGISSPSKVIISQTRAISVTRNLEDALRRFRLPNRPRRLWIDALSINQNDDKEKGHQIPLMTSIYRGAATVLVWLGHDAQVEASLNRLSKLGRLILVNKWQVSADDTADVKDCISCITNVGWFSRRWIIQEVVLNPDVILNAGFSKLSFLKFMRIVRMSGLEANKPSKQLSSTLSLFDLWEKFNTRNEDQKGPFYDVRARQRCYLLRLMRVFSHFGCADGRDHIFTIAALAQDVSIPTPDEPADEPSQLPLLPMPYGESVREIYIQFAEFLLNSGHLHWILARASARAGRVSDPTLPSWVPDWRVEELQRPFWTECRDVTWGINDSFRQDILSDDGALNKPKTYLADVLKANRGRSIGQDASLPRIKRTDRGDHQLKAEFSCLQHWPDPPFAVSTSPGEYKWEVPVQTYKEPPAWWFTKPSEENLFPLHVSWKSSGFEASGSDEDVLTWIRTVFKVIWARVIPPASQLSINMCNNDAVSENELLSKLLEKFDYVLTAGGMFRNHLASLEGQYLGINTSTVDILQQILVGINGPDPHQSLYLRLVTLTVRGRCLITCDIDSVNSAEIDRLVLGLGPSHVELEDCVTCIHGVDYRGPVIRHHWSRTYLLRKVPKNADAESEQPPRAMEMEDKSLTMRFVGDCFLTTSRWASEYEYEGFQPRTVRWEIWNSSLGWWHKRSSGIAKPTITLV